VIDRADVTLLPNLLAFAGGQDSMKLYDYAARGRPIVPTRWAAEVDHRVGPRCATAPDALARAVTEAAAEPPSARRSRRAWAADQRWSARWPAWHAAVLDAG
jgi:hypothetical protein